MAITGEGDETDEKRSFHQGDLGINFGAVLSALMSGRFESRQAKAQPDGGTVGRYQISAWSVQVGPLGHHSGYYVLDTVTGKVVEKHEEEPPAGPAEVR